MREISVSKFKATCLSLLDRMAETGESLMITKRGRPIAQISPPPKTKGRRSWLGSLSEKGRIVGDLMESVASEGEWNAFK